MKNVLIRAGKDYFENLSPEATLLYKNRSTFGYNVGFYLISDSVYKLISTPDTSIIPDSYLLGSRGSYKKNVAEEINENFDEFVLPVADFLKPKKIPYVKRLTTLIKNLDIPICVLGLGIGVYLDVDKFNDEKTNEVMEKFVSAILEKSTSIGVRGELTLKYLNRLGFDENEVKVLGCPSVYLNGPDYNIEQISVKKDSKIALNITPVLIKRYGGFVNKTIKNYKNYKYFMQDIHDLRIMLYGENGTYNIEYYNDKNFTKILSENKAMFPINSRTWINELQKYDYAIGTRLHGTVAALNARIPATLIVHDSRTQEIADYHKIPCIGLNEITKEMSVKDIAENSNWEKFNKVAKPNYKKLIKFFKDNEIDVVKEYPNPKITEKEKKAKMVGMVEQIYSKKEGINQKELLSRIRYSAMKKQYDYKAPLHIKNKKVQKRKKDNPSSLKKLKNLISKN